MEGISQAEIDYTNGLIFPLLVDAWDKAEEKHPYKPPKDYTGYLLFPNADLVISTYASRQRDINGLKQGNYWVLIINPHVVDWTGAFGMRCWCKCETLQECIDAFYNETVDQTGVDHSGTGYTGEWAYYQGSFNYGWDRTIIPYADKTYSFYNLTYTENPHKDFVVDPG